MNRLYVVLMTLSPLTADGCSDVQEPEGFETPADSGV